MKGNKPAPMGVRALKGASTNGRRRYYTTDEDTSARWLGLWTPDGTDPANAAITIDRERTWKGNPPRPLWRARRLNAPESCSVEGCDEPARVAAYPLVKGGEKTYQRGGAKPYH